MTEIDRSTHYSIIKAPDYNLKGIQGKYLTVFLAGGANTDWRKIFLDLPTTKRLNTCFFNPKRDDWGSKNFSLEEQIEWEYTFLRGADVLLFWFTEGSPNPISLYELGYWGNGTKKSMIIGIDPEYEKKKDVIKQTQLARPDIKDFHVSLYGLSLGLTSLIERYKYTI